MISQREIKVKTGRLPKARENAGVQVTIGFKFASRQILEQSKENQSPGLRLTELKMTFNKL